MKANLDTPNPNMGQQELDELNVNNIKKLRQTINKTGINNLVWKTYTTATTFTSTSYTTVDGMSSAFVSTGGFFICTFKTTVAFSGAITVYFKMVIDGKTLCFSSFVTPGFGGQIFLDYRGILGPGNHTIDIQAKIGSGTIEFSTNSSTTELQVVEFVL